MFASAQQAPPGALNVAQLLKTNGEKATVDDGGSEGAYFEGRALSLFNLVHHGGFGAGGETQRVEEGTKKVLDTLEKVAQQDTVGEITQVAQRQDMVQDKDWAFKDWGVRLRKVKFNKPPLGVLLHWVREAAEDSGASHARDIVQEGLNKLREHVTKEDQIADEIRRCKEELRENIRTAGFEFHAQSFFEFLDDRSAQEAFAKRSRESSIECAIEVHADMSAYISEVVRPLRTWVMKQAFLDHLATSSLPDSLWQEFVCSGGIDEVARFLREAPQAFDKTWGNAARALKWLANRSHRLLPLLCQLAERLSNRSHSSALTAFIEEKMATEVKDVVDNFLKCDG